LQMYTTVDEVERNGTAEDHMNLIENIVIYRIDRDSSKPPRASEAPERIAARREHRSLKRQRYLDRMTPEQTARYNTKRAEDERQRRESVKKKSTPEQIDAQKEKARERAKKSYNERSGKHGKKGDSNT
jgi:hypothetical protein